MATLTTFTAGTVIRAAEVNANFLALNTDLSTAMVCLYSARADAFNVGAAATSMHAFTLAANTLTKTGSGLLIRARANFAANANTKLLQFSIGSAFATMNVTTAAPNNKVLYMDLIVIRDTVTTPLCSGLAILSTVNTASSPVLEAAGEFVVTGVMGSFTSDLVVKFLGTGVASADIDLYTVTALAFDAP